MASQLDDANRRIGDAGQSRRSRIPTCWQPFADLEASPFTREGRRKVWARLRILRDIRVSRARVLRLMRENALLSPHRRPQGNLVAHDGSLQTDRANEMWGTDGIRVETVNLYSS